MRKPSRRRPRPHDGGFYREIGAAVPFGPGPASSPAAVSAAADEDAFYDNYAGNDYA